MQVIKCDKCKKELEVKTNLDSMHKVKFYFYGTLHVVAANNREYDLCSDCYLHVLKSFDDFMKK